MQVADAISKIIQVRIQMSGQPDLVRNFHDPRAASDWLMNGERRVATRTRPDSVPLETLTLRVALQRYSLEKTPSKKGAANELRRIKMWQRHPLGFRLLKDLRPVDFSTFCTERSAGKASGSTVRLDLAVVQNLYVVARLDWGMEGLGNPVLEIRKPKVARGRTRRLQGNEEERLLARYRERRNHTHAAIMGLALETAMRRGELLSLQWENINFEARVARLPDTKNGDSRDVPLSPRALAVLRDVGPKPSGQVFSVHPDNVTLRFREACKAKGIEGLRFHDLRHEATSRFFEKGLSLTEVRVITGHKTVQMLLRYTHLDPRKIALKLDDGKA